MRTFWIRREAYVVTFAVAFIHASNDTDTVSKCGACRCSGNFQSCHADQATVSFAAAYEQAAAFSAILPKPNDFTAEEAEEN